MSKKVLVAMSGGLDSTMSAKLLKDQGYDVLGVFMRLGIGQDVEERAARRVCNDLEIKFYPINLSGEFKKEVIDYFVESYRKGITPNPCVKCNKVIKFDKLIKLARDLGYGYVATGHYAVIKEEDGYFGLYRAADKSKDQSYFLYRLNQDELPYIIFPLGGYTKEEALKEAKKDNLPFAEGESQDICFVQGEHNEFLKENINLKKGPIKDTEGNVLGEHKGLQLYTIGQRKGVEVGGVGPLYVVECDYKDNTLVVAREAGHPKLFRDEFELGEINWIKKEGEVSINCEVVIRYGGKPVKARVKKLESGEWKAILNERIRAITPGQSAVFYNGDEVLGGGIIK